MLSIARLFPLLPFALLACNTSSPPPSSPTSAMAPRPAEAQPSHAAVDRVAPDFELADLDGRKIRLQDYRGKTVVLEWFNPECPFVKRNHTQGPLKEMAKRKMLDGVVWLSINSGAPGKQGNGVDKNREGKARYGMDNPILLDESGDVGHAYGAKSTPTMFVIDPKGTIVYSGAIDNAQDGETENGQPFVNYVDQALADLSAGRPVRTKETESYGCSVKYAKK